MLSVCWGGGWWRLQSVQSVDVNMLITTEHAIICLLPHALATQLAEQLDALALILMTQEKSGVLSGVELK